MISLFRAIMLACAAIVLSISPAFAVKDAWSSDYTAALEKARNEKKAVLLDFTGSDWCGWCIRLDRETFSQDAFKEFARKNLVLVEVDFPNAKAQPGAVKKQNEWLQREYGIQGFPTLVLLDSDGKEIARQVGYLPGGPAGFRRWVESALTKA